MGESELLRENLWYKASRLFAVGFLLSLAILVPVYLGHMATPPPSATPPLSNYSVSLPEPPLNMAFGGDDPLPPTPAPELPLALIISICAFCISAIGTASTVILGWRSERRQSAEFVLKIEQLQLQLAQARQSADVQPTNSN